MQEESISTWAWKWCDSTDENQLTTLVQTKKHLKNHQMDCFYIFFTHLQTLGMSKFQWEKYVNYIDNLLNSSQMRISDDHMVQVLLLRCNKQYSPSVQ